MIKYYIGFIVFCLWGCNTDRQSQQKDLFVEGATDWEIIGNVEWSFIDDALVGQLDSGGGFVITGDKYKDFELELEFYPDSTINSGVFVRCLQANLSATDCYEFNIWDLHPNQEFRTGSIVTRQSPLEHVNSLNKWNSYRIQCFGGHVKVWLNDLVTADLENDDLVEGFIALQAAGTGEIKFRNINLRSINKIE